MVDIGHGMQVPETIEYTTRARDCAATIKAIYDPKAGRYLVRSLTIEALCDHEVTSEMLRGWRIGALLRQAVEHHAAHLLHPIVTTKRDPQAGPTTETLQDVALIYRLALLAGEAPTQAVAAHLGIPKSTASVWVTRARDRGLLTVVDRRAPGSRKA